MKIIEKVTNVFNRLFRDEIVEIRPPREFWYEYRDIGRRLEGYKMLAKYKYKGWNDLLFSVDNDHFLLISKDQALKNAITFYEKNIARLNQGKVK